MLLLIKTNKKLFLTCNHNLNELKFIISTCNGNNYMCNYKDWNQIKCLLHII
jgi:hypothetical protein